MIPVLDPYEIVDAVQNGVRWEPIFTPALAARYHLDHLHSCIHQEDHLRERVEAPISLLLLQQVGV